MVRLPIGGRGRLGLGAWCALGCAPSPPYIGGQEEGCGRPREEEVESS